MYVNITYNVSNYTFFYSDLNLMKLPSLVTKMEEQELEMEMEIR